MVIFPAKEAPKPTPPPPVEEKEGPLLGIAEGEVAVVAPMSGMIIKYEVNIGDKVKAGDTIVILEAMKMENAIPAPTSGVVKAINFAPGASVNKNEVLAVIS